VAANKPLAPLFERVIGYPANAPQTMTELVDTSYDVLTALDADPAAVEVAIELRREIIHTIDGHERTAITSPEVVLGLLSSRRLRPLARKWITYALDSERKRRLIPYANKPTETTYARLVTKSPPRPEWLIDDLPLTEGGIYLVIYGGGPEVLSEGRTAQWVANLLAGVTVADVLFWQLISGQPPTLFSLRRGQGDRGGQPVLFPDPRALAVATGPALHITDPPPTQPVTHQGGIQS